MIARPAEPRDLASAVDLSMKFAAETLGEYGIEVLKSDVVAFAEKMIEGQVVLVAEEDGKVVGVLAGMITPYVFNTTKTVFQETIWYVEKEHRGEAGKLPMETLLTLLDVDYTIFANMHNSYAGIIDRFYTKLGFKPFETHWIRK